MKRAHSRLSVLCLFFLGLVPGCKSERQSMSLATPVLDMIGWRLDACTPILIVHDDDVRALRSLDDGAAAELARNLLESASDPVYSHVVLSFLYSETQSLSVQVQYFPDRVKYSWNGLPLEFDGKSLWCVSEDATAVIQDWRDKLSMTERATADVSVVSRHQLPWQPLQHVPANIARNLFKIRLRAQTEHG